MGLLARLEVLLLNDNRLVEVPKSIEKCSELTLLDLSNNQLTALRDEIPALASLKRLVLHHNALRSLPEAIGNLSCLEEFDLAHNRLLTLPESIGALHKLEMLLLFSNQLRLLPKEFGALSQLRHLNLDNNPKLINLKDFFGHLSSVSFFSASSCGIVTFESLDFLKDSPVRTLRLRQNALLEFPLLIGHAAMQDTLQELVLAGNHLSQVPLAVLLYCSHLQHLDLSNNSLRVLPTEIAHLRRLKVLYLSTNELQELPDELTQLPRLRAHVRPQPVGEAASARREPIAVDKVECVLQPAPLLANVRDGADALAVAVCQRQLAVWSPARNFPCELLLRVFQQPVHCSAASASAGPPKSPRSCL